MIGLLFLLTLHCRIYHVDLIDYKIFMERIDGIPLKELLRMIEEQQGTDR